MPSKTNFIFNLLKNIDEGVYSDLHDYQVRWQSRDKTAAFYCEVSGGIIRFYGLGKICMATRNFHLSDPNCVDELKSHVIDTLRSYDYIK